MALSIEVRNAVKIYGFNGQYENVLNELNMTVPRGTIYCLLGASGCGKTTLMSCILGVKKLNSGTIKVLNENVSHERPIHSINSIGYMPQETALSPIMTIKETLEFYANISRMNMKLFSARYQMLMNVLELPSGNILIENLSGGQQRRVSLAVALVHNPELLILDEPTVGLDVVICHKIWNFLKSSIAENKNLSVLMSTHYPHEAEKANVCAFMRHGKLLSESSPNAIMEILNVQNLDEATFALCYKENDEGLRASIMMKPEFAEPKNQRAELIFKSERKTLDVQILWALLVKKFIWLKRSRIPIMFNFLPIVQLILLIFTIGRPPSGLKIGIVNAENVNCTELLENSMNYDCKSAGLSCLLLDKIANDRLQKVSYDFFSDAFHDIKSGVINGIVDIPSNFSEELMKVRRMMRTGNFKNSKVDIYLDDASVFINVYLIATLTEFYNNFIVHTMGRCNYPPKFYMSPVIFKTYKEDEEYRPNFDFRNTMYPSIFLLTLISFTAIFMILSVNQYKFEEIWDRVILSGVNTQQLFIVEILLCIILAFIHASESIFVGSFLVDILAIKSYSTIICLFLVIALFGGCLGLFGASVFDNFSLLASVSIALMFMFTVASGLVCPIEGMPMFLKEMMMLMPTGLSTISLRNLILKDYDFKDEFVYCSFIILIIWIIATLTISLMYLRRNKFINS